jgi:hypothetical protein
VADSKTNDVESITSESISGVVTAFDTINGKCYNVNTAADDNDDDNSITLREVRKYIGLHSSENIELLIIKFTVIPIPTVSTFTFS